MRITQSTLLSFGFMTRVVARPRPRYGHTCSCGRSSSHGTLLRAQLLDKFERKSSPCSLISIHCRGKKDQVWSKKTLDDWEGDGRGLIDGQKLCLGQHGMVRGENVLNRLPMALEYIHPRDYPPSFLFSPLLLYHLKV